MTENNVLPIDKLSDHVDEITESLIKIINSQLESGDKPDIKLIQEVRQTYKDKLDFMKFMMKHELDKQKTEAQIPESAKRKKLGDVEVK